VGGKEFCCPSTRGKEGRILGLEILLADFLRERIRVRGWKGKLRVSYNPWGGGLLGKKASFWGRKGGSETPRGKEKNSYDNGLT